MNEVRYGSACAVFEGTSVGRGGYDQRGRILNTVEAYDHIADS